MAINKFENKINNSKILRWPKISIVTPSYNQANYIEATILSVLTQGYPNLEYIIIDGGSEDNTVDIIKKYEPELSYWISEADKGMYDALNKGFEKSTGSIMMWLNSDDMLHPGALFNVAEIFETLPEVDWLTGINTFFDDCGRIMGVGSAKNFSRFDFCSYNYKFIQQESTAWRRNLWELAGGKFDINIKLAGDLDLWVRFLRHANLYPCEAMVGGFRVRASDQLSFDQGALYLQEADAIIKKERQNLTNKDRAGLFIIETLNLTKKILKYSILFDWYVFRVFLDRWANLIHKKKHRIFINRLTCQFEIL